jgi:hypothetical protein
MSATKSENYLKLLKIRRAAEKRNLTITGAVFIVSFVMLIFLGMLDRLDQRSLFLTAAMIVPIAIAYLSVRIRLEIIKSMIEMIDTLLTD